MKVEDRRTKDKGQKKESLTPRLARLAQAIATTSSRRALTHADVEALLEFYVDSERRGENARTLYPTVWQHLQACDLCRTSYTLLTQALAENSEPSPEHPLPPLPFLTPQPEKAAWHKHLRSRIAGAPLGFGFTIHAEHLQKLVASSESALVLRNHTQPETKTLLLADHVPLGKRDVIVEVWTHRAEPNYLRLEIVVVASDPLPESLRVSVRWNAHHYTSPIRQGYGIIERIPIPDLQNARDLHVDFEEIPPERGQ